jgi:peroxiredoxin
MLAAGSKAPAFALQNLSGETSSLSDLISGGPVLLALYKASCPVCQLTLPYLDRLSQRGSLKVVAISQDDAKTAKRFQENFHLTLPILLDPAEQNYRVSNAFGIDHVPSLFLIEPDGTISLAESGFRKATMEQLGMRSNVTLFTAEDHVPVWKAG